MRARYLSLFSLPEAHTGICYWILNEIYCRFDSVTSFSSVVRMEFFVCLFVCFVGLDWDLGYKPKMVIYIGFVCVLQSCEQAQSILRDIDLPSGIRRKK